MAPAPSISKENLPLRLCRIDLFLKRNNQAVQSLQVLESCRWRIQRHNNPLHDFGRESRLSLQSRQSSFGALHLRKHLLLHGYLSNLLRSPDPGDSLQQAAIHRVSIKASTIPW